jgi:Rod binding domain-containing protein
LIPFVQPVGAPQPLARGFQTAGGSNALDSQMAAQALMGNTLLSHAPALSSQSQLNPLRPVFTLASGHSHSDAQIRQVSKDFEAIFLQMMLKEMRNSVQKSGLMGNSEATQFFESMQDEQLSHQLANAGGIGIGDIIYKQLQKASFPHQKTFS